MQEGRDGTRPLLGQSLALAYKGLTRSHGSLLALHSRAQFLQFFRIPDPSREQMPSQGPVERGSDTYTCVLEIALARRQLSKIFPGMQPDAYKVY